MKSKQADNTNGDHNTEEKIKEAAKKVFLKKGFNGATTRDIAEEAGVNLALVNYYFRSKEKLFKEVFEEKYITVSRVLTSILESDLPIEVKIYKVAEHYTELFLKEPNIPLFIVTESLRNADKMYENVGMKRVKDSGVWEKQLQEEAAKGNIRPISPFHLELSLVSLLMFQFMSRPVAELNGINGDEAFEKFIRERQKLIPEMIMAYLRDV
jgi:AcrR family transcriptional regulator